MNEVLPLWLDEDVFVIGGGESLKGFAWDRLKDKNTVGANDAFRLGPEVCKVCIFGDASWWQAVKFPLQAYGTAGGRVYSISSTTQHWKIPYVHQLTRTSKGLQEGTHLAWNLSTGAAAINLALNLGAARVFLLGYDMGGGHWHDYTYRPYITTEKSFIEFAKGFKVLALAAKAKYPNVPIYNVGDGTSRLKEFFPISFAEMWELTDGTG